MASAALLCTAADSEPAGAAAAADRQLARSPGEERAVLLPAAAAPQNLCPCLRRSPICTGAKY